MPNEEAIIEHTSIETEEHNSSASLTHEEQVAHTEEVSHEQTLFAEEIFHIGNFPVTNSLINSWAVVFIVVVLTLVIRKRVSLVPRGIQNLFEMVVEVSLGIFDSVTGSRKKSMKFFPLVFTFFVVVLINNYLGLLPGVGSIGKQVMHDGHKVFVPFFRAGTADLNMTLALASIGVVVSHIWGVLAVGIWHHFNKFVNIQALLDIPKKIKEDPSIIIVNPIKVFVGFIEIIGEVAKVASLSFRLFGNIFAGEVLLASMSSILAFGLPIPFMFMEVMVGSIQALIFAMLVLSYLAMNTTKEAH